MRTLKESIQSSARRVFHQPGWLGKVLVGGFLLGIPIVNLWAIGQIVLRAGREPAPGSGEVRWTEGWAEGLSAVALAGGYASLVAVLGFWLGELLDVSRLFSVLTPFVWVVLGLAGSVWTVAGLGSMARGAGLFRAADPAGAWARIRRGPALFVWAALVPYIAALLGIWILPQALFLGVWMAVELAADGAAEEM